MNENPTVETEKVDNSEIQPTQALSNLYVASKIASLPANDHDILKASAIVLQKFITEHSESK